MMTDINASEIMSKPFEANTYNLGKVFSLTCGHNGKFNLSEEDHLTKEFYEIGFLN